MLAHGEEADLRASDEVSGGGDRLPTGDFEGFYLATFDRVFRACYLAGASSAAAEDASQEAFVRAYERWGRLQKEAWATGWVMRTALNLVRRSHRRAPAREMEAETLEAPSADAVALRLAIGNLPRRQRDAVIHYYVGDLPLATVASIMRCSEGTVKSHLSRARQNLKSQLMEDVGNDE